LFIIKGMMGKVARVVEVPEPQKTFEPQIPQISEELPEALLAEPFKGIEANIDPELERARMELNDTIMADPAEAARLLVSFIKE
jgi:hypothetical protein